MLLPNLEKKKKNVLYKQHCYHFRIINLPQIIAKILNYSAQSAFTYSKITTETLEQEVKYVRS